MREKLENQGTFFVYGNQLIKSWEHCNLSKQKNNYNHAYKKGISGNFRFCEELR